MRIVHEFLTKAQVCGGGKPYISPCAEPRAWQGFSVDLLITVRNFGDEDALHIEGDGYIIRDMLRTALDIVESAEKYARESVAAEAARQVQCRSCQTWVDPFSMAHADGKGSRCAVKHFAMIEGGTR